MMKYPKTIEHFTKNVKSANFLIPHASCVQLIKNTPHTFPAIYNSLVPNLWPVKIVSRSIFKRTTKQKTSSFCTSSYHRQQALVLFDN